MTKKTIFSLIVVIFSLLFAIAVGELFLRFVYSPESIKIRVEMNKLAQDDRSMQRVAFDRENMRFYPNTEVRISHPEYAFTTRHDRYGWRNPCFRRQEVRQGYFLVGASTVYGIGVDDKQTFSCVLNTEARASAFYTAGIPGTGPSDFLQIIQKNSASIVGREGVFADHPPTLILLISPGLDFESLTSLWSQNKLPENHAGRSFLWEINKYWVFGPFAKSYFFQGVKVSTLKLWGQLRGLSDKVKYYTNYAGATFYRKGTPRVDNDLLKSITLFKNSVRQFGYKELVILLIPDAADIDPKRLDRDATLAGFRAENIDADYKYKSILEACERSEVKIVDARDVLNSADYYVSDGHLRPSGVAKVATQLRKYLAPSLPKR